MHLQYYGLVLLSLHIILLCAVTTVGIENFVAEPYIILLLSAVRRTGVRGRFAGRGEKKLSAHSFGSSKRRVSVASGLFHLQGGH